MSLVKMRSYWGRWASPIMTVDTHIQREHPSDTRVTHRTSDSGLRSREEISEAEARAAGTVVMAGRSRHFSLVRWGLNEIKGEKEALGTLMWRDPHAQVHRELPTPSEVLLDPQLLTVCVFLHFGENKGTHHY